MLTLVRTVFFDCRNETGRLGMLGLHGLQDTIESSITPMLVVDVDRPKDVEIAAGEPSLHCDWVTILKVTRRAVTLFGCKTLRKRSNCEAAFRAFAANLEAA